MPLYQQIAEAEEKGILCAICTIIGATGTTPRKIGSKMLVYADGNVLGSIGGGSVENEVTKKALESIANRQLTKDTFLIDSAHNREGDGIEVVIEPIIPAFSLVIVGAGHIGKQVAFLGKALGWHIVVMDDRTELCNKAVIPQGDEFLCGFSAGNIAYCNQYSGFYVFATRSSELDIAILSQLLLQKPQYVGILGSEKRWAGTRAGLLAVGLTEEQLANVFSPVGIKIQAETPQEIAVSIIAQIIEKTKHRM
jgi:xanthine dehydrogenase accessory factor